MTTVVRNKLGKPNRTLISFDLPPFPEFAKRGEQACGEVADKDIFFPVSFANEAAVRAIRLVCGACPVRAECAEHGIEHEVDGAWGGLTPDERREIRRRRGLA